MNSTLALENRYERKFLPPHLGEKALIELLKQHPAHFQEIYEQRTINNIYYDTPQFSFYLANAHGIGQRSKLRIRWYGPLEGEIQNPKLEIKRRMGVASSKQSIVLNPFCFQKNSVEKLSLPELIKDVCPADLSLSLKSVHPVLINRYTRRYFQSQDKKFRMTLDTDLHFHSVLGCASFPNKESQTILEMKYSYGDDSEAEQISNFFTFRLSKFSKYIQGIEKCYGFEACDQ